MTTDGFRLMAVLSTRVRESSRAVEREIVDFWPPSGALRDEAVAAAAATVSVGVGAASTSGNASGRGREAVVGISSTCGQLLPPSACAASSPGGDAASGSRSVMAGSGVSSGSDATPGKRSVVGELSLSAGPATASSGITGGVSFRKSPKSGSGANSGRGARSGSDVNPGNSPNSGNSGTFTCGSAFGVSEGRVRDSSSEPRRRSSLFMRRFYERAVVVWSLDGDLRRTPARMP